MRGERGLTRETPFTYGSVAVEHRDVKLQVRTL